MKWEWEEDGKDATGAQLGKASRASQGLWLLPQAMEHRNDMSNSNLKGSTQMFTEYRQMVIRQEGFPGGSGSKQSACNAGETGSSPGRGRAPREGNGYPLQYFCLENSMDRGAWQVIQSMGSQRVGHY